MNFLNIAMIGGLAAGAIPLIIHLFHKSRFKVVNWGAMHLLEAVLRTNQKRVKVEQWILLAIRTAIPILLALMMARPMWQGAKKLLGEQATSTAVLLDNSYSMEAGRAGASNFSIARDESQRLIGGLKRGSEAYVFLMGEGAGLLDEPTRDISRVTQALDKVGSGYGVARVPAALPFSIDWLPDGRLLAVAVGVAVGVSFLGERYPPLVWAGLSVVAAGIGLTTLAQARAVRRA